MSCRADWTEVIAINGSTLSEPAINAFLLPASIIIDNVADSCPDIAKTALQAAEVQLACHMMAVSNVGQKNKVSPIESEKFEDYSIKLAIAKSSGDGVLSTQYGVLANTLTGGCLQEQDKRNAGVFFAGGA